MILETRAVPPFFKNGYLLGCEDTRLAVLIDPGDETPDMLTAIEHHRLEVRYILLTHAHLDLAKRWMLKTHLSPFFGKKRLTELGRALRRASSP